MKPAEPVNSLPRQLSLRLSLDDEATFDNFYLPPEQQGNSALVNHLRQRISQWSQADADAVPGTVLSDFSWLWGSTGAGCSHLLQAACHQAAADGLQVFYLDLSCHDMLDPAVLQGLESVSVLCLDSIDAVAGLADWELALFHLYNRMAERNTPLLVAAHSSPQYLKFALADLQSRMQSAAVFQLLALADEEKTAALQMRALRQGFELPQDVADYLVSRSERSMSTLFSILQQLDRHSLETRRKVTIPLLKSLMGW